MANSGATGGNAVQDNRGEVPAGPSVYSRWPLFAVAVLGVLALSGGAYWLGSRSSDGVGTIAAQVASDSSGEASDSAAVGDSAADGDGAEGQRAHGDGAEDQGGHGDGAEGANVGGAEGAAAARLTATLESGEIHLGGVVPNNFIVERVVTISDSLFTMVSSEELAVQTSLPHVGWGPGADEAVAALAIVSNGTIELHGDSATIQGEPNSAEVQLRFRSAVEKALGPAVQLIDETQVVERSLPSLMIKKTGANRIEITGVVPNEGVATDVEQSIASAYTEYNIGTDLSFDEGVLDSFALYRVPALAALFVEFPGWEVSYLDGELRTSSSGAASFGSDSTDLQPASTTILDSIADGMTAAPATRLVVEGHTDSRGSDEANFELSQDRAEAVIDYLINLGIDEARLTAVGFGEVRPVDTNGTEEGRARNRRVTLIVNAPGG